MNAFVPLGIVFLVVGGTIAVTQGVERSIAFLAIGVTFIVVGTLEKPTEDDTDDT